MKAICIESPWHILIREKDSPQIIDDMVLIKVKSIGICGSDIAAYAGTNPLVTYPRLIGHEIAGEVVEVADSEKDFTIGDRVVLEPYIYCGNCYPCSIERFNCCENLKVLGVHVDGGMCEYISHPKRLLYKIDKNIPWHLLALVEPLSIAVHAVERSRLESGEYALIIGCGPIGLLTALYVIYNGGKAIIVDPVEKRLDLAKSLGVYYTINSSLDDVYNQIKKITNGIFPTVVIEASGNISAIQASLEYVSFAGRIVLVGWPNSDLIFKTSLVTKKEIDILGSRNSCKNFPECIDIVVNNKIDIEGVLSKIISFGEIPLVVEDIYSNPKNYMKVVAIL